MLLDWIWDGFVSGLLKVLDLWFLIPISIGLQLLKDSGWLRKVSTWLRPVLAPFRLPEEAALPIAAGLTVGITYGAGVILQASDEGKMSRDDLTITCVFLGICHAVIEETILFTAIGVNGFLLLAVRLIAGLLFAYGTTRWIYRKRAIQAPSA